MEDRNLFLPEWTSWKTVCDRLLASGAVTSQDLLSPVGLGGTKGRDLLNAIREWAQAYSDLAAALKEGRMG